MTAAPILLVSEARGEFLVVERIRKELAVLGHPSVHVTAAAADASAEELAASEAIPLDAHAEYRRAATVRPDAIAARVAAEESKLGINLRSVWRADLRSWREGRPDDELARAALGYLAAWRAILADAGEPALLWGEDGGHLAKRMAFALAEHAGIRTTFLYASPLPGRMLHLDNQLNRFPAGDFAATEPTEEEREYAEALLEDIRSSRVQFATPRDLAFRPGRIARFGRLLADRYVTKPPGSQALYPWTFLRSYARQNAVKTALAPAYRPIGSRPFLFHTVHAGFDAQITIRAPQWRDQVALIEHVAASLPYGYELAVKEHPFEVGALPYGRLRSLLRRRPEIRLLNPAIHAHEALRRCAAVTTVNSTVGFEALFFGRPVVTFGHGPYRGLGLTTDVHDPFDTPRLLADAVRGEPPREDDVVRLVAFLHRRSFEATPIPYDAGDANIRRYADAFAALAGWAPATSHQPTAQRV